jgi:hypothetical protein
MVFTVSFMLSFKRRINSISLKLVLIPIFSRTFDQTDRPLLQIGRRFGRPHELAPHKELIDDIADIGEMRTTQLRSVALDGRP